MNAPNILLIVSDQERQRDWIPEGFNLPARQRLMDQGLEFTRYYTHTSPCSPARGTLFTGQYLPVHGVNENCIMPANGELSTDAQTLGKLLEIRGITPDTRVNGTWPLMLSQTWTLTVSATGKATTKLFGDKLEAELNLMNPSHAQPQTGYETEMENQTRGFFPWVL